MADDGGVELAGERLDPLLQRVALIGQGQRGAVLVGRPGDAPGDRAVVRDPHDQAALAGQDARPGRLGDARDERALARQDRRRDRLSHESPQPARNREKFGHP
jgi:hypothetical protein